MRTRWLLSILAVAVNCLAHADDGILYYRGGPELMKGGAQIRMVQEFVRSKVYRDHATFYCRFVLRNEGGATVARIGFPDGSDHDGEDYSAAEPTLEHFRSAVDGRPIKVHLERSARSEREPFAFFEVKKVRFSSHQTRIVEDWYDAPLDDGATETRDYYVRGLSYVMTSGGSWRGNIGRATVEFDFLTKRLRAPHPVDLSEIGYEPYQLSNWNRIPRNHVFWDGFTEPIHIGKRLIFRRQNFKPTEGDDIRLAFGAHQEGWIGPDKSIERDAY